MKKVLICGAGKIGRGFIGQLFHHSEYELHFLDAVQMVVDALNKDKKYRLDLATTDVDKTEYIPVGGAYSLADAEKVSTLLNEINVMVSCVGAPNIASTVNFLKPLLKNRKPEKYLNWIICENADQPSQLIKKLLLEEADNDLKTFVEKGLGLVETQVLRTGMLAKPEIQKVEPLALRMQDWWTLPADKDAFVGQIPEIKGLILKSNFQNELTRKIYTFNGTNGPISYVGWANGFRILDQAGRSPKLEKFITEIQQESGYGLIKEYNLDPAEQKQFQSVALGKYQDPALNDQIERNACDSRRKIGGKERLVGPATLCLKHGKQPIAYAIAIAAALAYDGSDDAGTQEVLKTVREKGIAAALKEFSGLEENSPLTLMVKDAFDNKKYLF
jgi:mannitol-1-phosphate 5-dehydrogenase